ncbi:site-specific integrase [Aliarcobacter cryaerophilus]|uniref:tyrosine-type recombinase/integrase n=1 Tax=Aliarcobacter cryaerophilus TaxID=28198 RepID=UPI0021B6BB38|nr:site-specific integrase [Aliarcobacter cryaerophilus]MCT7466494.1 site-specific integrase [Aliarcobacter cryaerophilus]
MAINRNDFPNKIESVSGLKASKNYDKFFYRFKIEGKTFYTTFDYTNKNWDKKTRETKAMAEALEYRDNKKDPQSHLDDEIKVDNFLKLHFEQIKETTWKTTKIRHYNNYLKNDLGKKKIKDIKQMHIKNCIKKQEELGLSGRTVKTTLEILNPLFKEAIANRLITFNPCDGITVKRPKTKKIVTNPREYIINIYNVINEVFKDNPFYKSLFLFYLQGRRKSEPLKLKWKNIDFNNDSYTCEIVKNGETQTFYLPENIKEELLKFKSNIPDDYVYEANIKGQPIKDFRKQILKIQNIIEGFTLHFLRNVVVTMMAEEGINSTFMSSALGHNNINTLRKYLTMPYAKGSKVASDVINLVIKDNIK